MSDISDYFNENQGYYSALGNIAAIGQRNQLLAAQRQQIAVLERQYSAIQQTEAQRLELERRRLHLEELRASTEAEERALKQEQLDKLKEIRNLLVDTAFALEQLKKISNEIESHNHY